MILYLDDGMIKVWNAANGGLLHTLDHDGPVSCMSLNSQTGMLVSGSDDTHLRSWGILYTISG